MCRIAMSRDFLERLLPKPELSGDDEDFPPAQPLEDPPCSSRLGGASRLKLTTLSTILLPMSTGLTPSTPPPPALDRATAGMEVPPLRTGAAATPLGALPREGEQD